MAALDQLRRSLYIGDFSKSVSAALRVGYIAGSKEAIDELAEAEVFCRPEQSLYLWARFPGIEDTAVLTREVQGRGVMLAPGAIFQTNQKAVTPWTLLNVAFLQEPVFAQCIRA
ncbi:GntR family transcriptional regulator [Pseudomonas putida]|uniref:GntR family transcriptional regulator n=1 Tax=Pseudomonas putida NBRC 14164 TaxID=1211579 RepID=A0ABM7EGR3_PSEPU|nr:hypothetical protein PP4_31540 [Pseudomonas putida NBRC 14164]GLO10745.1 hypothetical protein PPUJ20005_47140 [Pseudomonas putida]GLO24572.1 hypothetical protein PPUJ21368_24000 [Pseudomonas putida]SUD75669.1 GntR family transcriptional regulator [Pseudomonas putida]